MLQVWVLSYAGCTGAYSWSITCKELFSILWGHAALWLALLEATGCPQPPFSSATELRDIFRRQSCGIDALLVWRLSPPPPTNQLAMLASARRALNAFQLCDADPDIVIAAVADLLRWCNVASGAARQYAGGLLQAAASRPDVFDAGQVGDLQDAFSESLQVHRTLQHSRDSRRSRPKKDRAHPFLPVAACRSAERCAFTSVTPDQAVHVMPNRLLAQESAADVIMSLLRDLDASSDACAVWCA